MRLIFIQTGPWWSKIPLGYYVAVPDDKCPCKEKKS